MTDARADARATVNEMLDLFEKAESIVARADRIRLQCVAAFLVADALNYLRRHTDPQSERKVS